MLALPSHRQLQQPFLELASSPSCNSQQLHQCLPQLAAGQGWQPGGAVVVDHCCPAIQPSILLMFRNMYMFFYHMVWLSSTVGEGSFVLQSGTKSTSMCQEAELLSIRLRMVGSSCNKPVASDCTDVYRSARLGRERGSASSGGQCCSRKFPDPAVLPSTSNLVTLGQFPSLKVTPASRTVSQGIMQILGSTKLEQDCAHPCRF